MNISTSIRLVSLTISLLFCSGAAATAKELIKNGGFNEGSTYWRTWCVRREAYANDAAYGGPNPNNRVAEVDDETCIYQDVCVLPGFQYQFSMKASRRTAGGSTPSTVTTNIKIAGLDAANNVVATFVNMDFTRSNTSFALTPVTGIPSFSVPLGSGVVYLRVSLEDKTPGFSTLGMIIDDLSLELADTFAITGPDSICNFGTHQFMVTNMPPSDIYYEWDFGADATPATSTLPNPFVSWTASGVKQVTCMIGNGACYFDTLSFEVSVFSGSTTHREYRICPGASVQLSATMNPVEWRVVPGGSPLSSLSCTNCTNPSATPDQTTVYYAVSPTSSALCPSIDTVVVHVERDNAIRILPDDTLVVCRPDYIRLKHEIIGYPPLQRLSCGPVATRPGTPSEFLSLDPFMADLNPAPNGSMATPFPALQQSGRHQYLIRAADLKAAGMFSGTLTGMALLMAPNSVAATLTDVRIALRCVNIDDFDGFTQLITGTTEVLFSSSVSVPAGGGYVWFPFTTFYNRDTAMNLLVEICYDNSAAHPVVPVVCASTPYHATLYDSAAAPGYACAGNGVHPTVSKDLPVFRFSYDLAPEAEWDLQWADENGVLSNGADPEVFVRKNTRIHVTTYSRNGCLLVDTVEVYVPDMHMKPVDTSICAGDRVWLQAMNGQTYQWYEDAFRAATTLSCANCPDPVARPAADVRYAVVVTDHGCADTFYAKVQVTPYPDLRVWPEDTVISYGEHAALHALGADSYVWAPAGSLDLSDNAHPLARPVETTVYTVTGYAAKDTRCNSTASVRVRVEYSDSVRVPNAFTPNGDGLNDVFRLVNVTYQKIPEFRVFNRWGEEVFYAIDNRGWDGTRNGVPEPGGVYAYLIRVALPDGTMKMFKGNVTLLR
jgi:gliding motility-associated-like protein